MKQYLLLDLSHIMDSIQIRKNIERWLVHENYDFNELKNDNENFHFIIKNEGSFKIPIDIFQPTSQSDVIVLGGRITLNPGKRAKFLRLSQDEQEKFKGRINDYCYSIQAIVKIFEEEGNMIIGVYLVLDEKTPFTRENILESIPKIIEMNEKTNQFLIKM